MLSFQDIWHFIFPSRYVHDAVPLVLYEALAASAVGAATREGSIPEQFKDSPSLLADNADSFVEQVMPALSSAVVSHAVSDECRRAYLTALSDSESQLTALVDLLAGR